jgi:RNase P protein component
MTTSGGRTDQRLPRAVRVRNRPEFERAYESGVKLHGRLMMLFIVPNGDTQPVRRRGISQAGTRGRSQPRQAIGARGLQAE